MKNIDTKKISNGIKNLALVYCIAGSIYSVTDPYTTGHQGVDLSTGRKKATKLEKMWLNSILGDKEASGYLEKWDKKYSERYGAEQ